MFEKKTWVNRQSEHPSRRRLTPSGNDNEYDVARAEGLVMEEGDAFDADTMNDLERRIGAGFSELDPTEAGSVNVTVQPYTCVKTGKVYALEGSGAVGRFKVPAAWSAGDTWTVNGVAVPAYCGADAADGDCVAAGRWITFVYDGTRLDFNGGGGLSAGKLAQATATEADVLANSAFYAKDKTLRTGNVPRRGNWGATIAPGGSVTVPSGKHDGGGVVSAKALKTITMNVGNWPHEYPAMEWHYTLTGGTLVGIAALDGASGDGATNIVDSIRIAGNTIYVANRQGGAPWRNITLIYY